MGGRRIDGVSSYPASEADLALYDQGAELIARQPRPRLLTASDADSRMFFANFDGSGQDMHRPGSLATNIGALHADLMARVDKGDQRTATEYLSGPGTQKSWITRGLDSALGFTADDRAAEMYVRLARQADDWLRQNPDSYITLAASGYSRGAISAVMFTRLVDRYGILDPEGLRFGRDANGDLTVQSDRAPLVPPGRTAQALFLLDPVSTGIDRDFDLRPPPSVITGVSFWAAHERRWAFPHHALIDLGLSEDGRFAGVLVPGAHANVGGGNRLNGLEIRAGNLLRQGINGLSDSRLLAMREVPEDPSMNVIHRSHQALLGAFQIGSSPAGAQRRHRDELCVIVDPCRDAEPRNDALAERYLPQASARVHAGDDVPRLTDAAHPAHGVYRTAREGIAALDREHGVADVAGSDRAAAALVAAARESGVDRITHVVLGPDRRRLFAVDTDDLHSVHRRTAFVDVATAREQPVEVSTQRFDAAAARQATVQAPAQAMEMQPSPEMRARSLVH